MIGHIGNFTQPWNLSQTNNILKKQQISYSCTLLSTAWTRKANLVTVTFHSLVQNPMDENVQ